MGVEPGGGEVPNLVLVEVQGLTEGVEEGVE